MKYVSEFQHQCLVREVIRMRIEERDKAHEFLRMWEKNHDDHELRAMVKAQWELGNRGEKNDWRTP
ncbi:hypothetical protein EBT31_14325 [bacterium]|nr:hypothetical protein [bacterium]